MKSIIEGEALWISERCMSQENLQAGTNSKGCCRKDSQGTCAIDKDIHGITLLCHGCHKAFYSTSVRDVSRDSQAGPARGAAPIQLRLCL